MIGSVVNASGYALFGRADALPRDASAVAPDDRLLDGAGATLKAMHNGRTGIEQIVSALKELRDTLRSARDRADAVPGLTELKPVFADVEQMVDQPTFVTINGKPVQSGTVTVSQGMRSVIVGYERANRAPLDVGETLKSLASNAATLISSVGADGTSGFAARVSALLRSDEFTKAIDTPDTGALDAAIGQIDDALVTAEGLRLSVGMRSSAAGLIDLGGILLSALSNGDAGSATRQNHNSETAYRSTSSGASSARVLSLV